MRFSRFSRNRPLGANASAGQPYSTSEGYSPQSQVYEPLTADYPTFPSSRYSKLYLAGSKPSSIISLPPQGVIESSDTWTKQSSLARPTKLTRVSSSCSSQTFQSASHSQSLLGNQAQYYNASAGPVPFRPDAVSHQTQPPRRDIAPPLSPFSDDFLPENPSATQNVTSQSLFADTHREFSQNSYFARRASGLSPTASAYIRDSQVPYAVTSFSVDEPSSSAAYQYHSNNPPFYPVPFSSSGCAAPRNFSLPLPSPSDESQRPVTPCDTGYQQLGGMRFGSLRIMNGSPAPSVAADVESDEPETQSTFMSHNGKHHNQHLSLCRRFSELSEQTTPDIDSSDNVSSTDSIRSVSCYSQSSTTPSSAEEPSPTDECSIDYSAEVLDVKKGLHAESDFELQPDPCLNQENISQPDSNLPSNASIPSEKPLGKTDSGYSSTMSTRSFGSSASTPYDEQSQLSAEEFKQPNIEPDMAQIYPIASATSSLSTFINSDVSIGSDKTPRNSGRGSWGALRVSASTVSLRLRRFSLSDNKPSQLNAVDPKDNISKSESSQPSDHKRSFSLTSLSGFNLRGKQNPSRLPVKPRQTDVPTMLSKHDISGIPAVPQSARERLREHTEQFPVAPQRLALRRERSRESLHTISEDNDEGNEFEARDKLTSMAHFGKKYAQSSRNSRRHSLQALPRPHGQPGSNPNQHKRSISWQLE